MTAEAERLLAAAPELGPAQILERAGGENFPVAPRVLPRRWREPLEAIYGFARLADEIGDAAAGDRLALLDALEDELARAYDGEARHPLLRRLAPVLAAQRLPREPFARLIEANRVDQRLRAVQSWEELLACCALSANPVGELVLHVFGAATPERVALSDQVCSALQVIEHCQDVAEDRARGRVYLPAQDLAAHGCGAADLARPYPIALRRVVALEIARARVLLGAGTALLAQLDGFARVAVAGYIAGGLATCEALARAGFDAGSVRSRPRRGALLRHAACLLLGREAR